jgi:uncharacterized membrane protein
MEAWVLVVILVVGAPIILAIWLIVRAVKAGNRIEELSLRLGALEMEVFRLKKDKETAHQPETAPAETPVPRVVPSPTTPKAPAPVIIPHELRPASPPPAKPVVAQATAPPPIPPKLPPVQPIPKPAFVPQRKPAPAINWEQFMGVKGLAYTAGLAASLGVAFAVKYSFEKNWITPELRVAFGFITGIALLIGGTWLHRKKEYIVGAQTLCATGVLILYATTFACRSIYHFDFFGVIPTFLLMVLITTTAFLIAVRLNALVVAILGMLGGFLTPVLLSTGVDNPLGLFGYIAILDAGLILVALNRRWFFLTALAAVGTGLMQVAWANEFFVREKYFEGDKILVALAVLLGFNVLYLAATWLAGRREKLNWWIVGSTLGLAAVALAFTPWFLDFAPLAQRPWLMFGFVFLIDLVVTALVLIEKEISPAQPLAGIGVFGLLALWTGNSLSNELLNAALAFYFIFAVFHSVFPAVQQRRGIKTTLWGGQLFPPLALALVLIPIFKLTDLSFAVWPFVLLVDLLAIGLAVLSVSLLPVLAVLLLTLAATGALIFKIPTDLTGLPTSFFLLGAFAVFFVVASTWLVRKFKPDALASGVKLTDDFSESENLAALLPAFSAALPFLLLIMATMRLPLVNPSPVFGLALLLVVLLLGIAKMFSFDWIPAVALACVASLECVWHFNRFDVMNPAVPPTLPLTWYLVFFGVFTLFPFVFLKKFSDKAIPWATSALVGLPQFFLIYRLVKVAWPNDMMGLLPAAFAIPPLLGLVIVLKKFPATNTARMTQLAWFGGVALFFITLIFPIQFDRQWITLGWALEGAALLWLFHRVPHGGLRLTGVGLLIAAFVRLALNLEVFGYHPRSATPILNWYLYTYGIATVCFFVAARLLAPPRNKILGVNAPPILAALGTVLAFLLMNIEIADYFTAAGSTVRFQFGGNFGREMTYTISWALFALVLIVVGIIRKLAASRYAALGLLSVTLLKLFLHDLAHLSLLYRSGAFVGVAIIAMLASFAYQRFFSASLKERETKDETTQ